MDPKLKKRIYAFYFAGVINLALGLYMLVAGTSTLPRNTAMMLMLFFFGFAAVDFYFPKVLKKKWLDLQKQLEEQRKQAGEAKAG